MDKVHSHWWVQFIIRWKIEGGGPGEDASKSGGRRNEDDESECERKAMDEKKRPWVGVINTGEEAHRQMKWE